MRFWGYGPSSAIDCNPHFTSTTFAKMSRLRHFVTDWLTLSTEQALLRLLLAVRKIHIFQGNRSCRRVESHAKHLCHSRLCPELWSE